MEGKVSPYGFLAMTFTNKAAQEMRNRILKLGASIPQNIWVGTFHALCARILRKHADLIGYDSNFNIIDKHDQATLVRECLKELNIGEKSIKPFSVLDKIDHLKNNGLSLKKAREEVTDYNFIDKKIYEVIELYEKKLLKSNSLDFGDLIGKVVDLFSEHKEVHSSYYDKWPYIFVDEFQDTNVIQYTLVKLLVGNKLGVTVVGDDDQSIYRWRGANIDNILHFQDDFKNTKIIKLEQNYRSTKLILQAASSVVLKNTQRLSKTLWTENEVGEKINYHLALDEKDEARFVIEKIEELATEDGQYRNVAIFYRTNAQSRVVEEELIKHGIPYAMFGGFKFYERKEIKDILAYLRFLENPYDGISFRRIVKIGKKGIGDKTIEKIDWVKNEHGTDYLEALRIFTEANTGASSEKIKKEYDLFNQVRTSKATIPPHEWVRKLLNDSGYWGTLNGLEKFEAESRKENITEFLEAIYEYFNENKDHTLSQFLEKVSLVSDTDRLQETEDKITLMTIHCAKGLEFDHIIMIGMEEGLFPHSRSMDSLEEYEEERRLCYVGITRARKSLSLSSCRLRRIFGSVHYNMPTSFIKDIPKNLLEVTVSPQMSEVSY